MGNSEKKTSMEAQEFFNELNKAARRIGEKYGFKVPDISGVEVETGVFINISGYKQRPDDVFRKWYLEKADEMGLNKSWAGIVFTNHDKSRNLTLIGLDPDGGDRCIRVRDTKNQDFHISPATLSRLVVVK